MIESLIKNERAELTQDAKSSAAVVLSTRLRLARKLAEIPFPGRASKSQRSDILTKCAQNIQDLKQMKSGAIFKVSELTELEKQVLVERHLISRELCENKEGSAVLIDRAQTCSIMVNEEDHLRIQFLKAGFNLKSIWKKIDAFDTELEKSLNFAFSSEFGFLTACPTNLGTGLRASVMMHLPGLVISNQMERVIRAVNQLGITVRGLFGEGSDATGHVFQISNQQTLGESEAEIIDRLSNVLKATIDHEINARFKYLESNRASLLDQIGRAYGILKNAHEISSNEAMNLLSFMRLAVDFNLLPDEYRTIVDRLFIECQPGHIQYAAQVGIEPEARDITRADKLREEFNNMSSLDFDNIGKIA